MQTSPAIASPETVQPIAFSIRTALQAAGGAIGRTKLYEALACGALPARKSGTRTVILAGDLQAFLASLPPYQPQQAA